MSETSTEAANLQTARRYLEAISRNASWEEVAAFFTDDVVQEEFPNRLVPNGARRGLEDLRQGAERGRTVMAAQRYDVRGAIASGDPRGAGGAVDGHAGRPPRLAAGRRGDARALRRLFGLSRQAHRGPAQLRLLRAVLIRSDGSRAAPPKDRSIG
jgi:ketosteroid isomerase-like protein